MFQLIKKVFLSNKKINDLEYIRMCEVEEVEKIIDDIIESIKIFGLKIKFNSYDLTINTWKIFFTFFSVVDEKGKTEFTPQKKVESLLDDFKRIVNNEKLLIKTENKMICFELPKPKEYKQIFYFADMMKDKNLIEEMKSYKLPFVTGINYKNDLIIEDLVDMPHVLVAGTTGSGKSVFLNNLICGMLKTKSSDEISFAFIDPKCVELTQYKFCKKYLFSDVVTNCIEKAITLMQKVFDEMHFRNELLEKNKVKNIDQLKNLGVCIKRLVLIVDEFSNVTHDSKSKKMFDDLVLSLGQMGRACGIHLVLCTQRTSVDIVRGSIKNVMPCRISFSLPSSIDSKTILDEIGAESLNGGGDGIIKNDKNKYRFQSPFVTEKDIEKIIERCK